jgi:hypothetical protein
MIGYTNGYNIVEVLLLDHEYALPENEILILDNDNIEVGDVVAVDGTILANFDDNIIPPPETDENQVKQDEINRLNSNIQAQTDTIAFHQSIIDKCDAKIALINANTPNITFGSAEIRNAPDNAARLVLLNTAKTNAQNGISLASAKIDEFNSELTILQS